MKKAQKDAVIGNKLEDVRTVAEQNRMTMGQLLMRAIKGELSDKQVQQLEAAKNDPE